MSDTLSLTDVQRQVLAHLGEPLTVAQIAQRLSISDKRVYQLMGQLTTKGLLRDDLPLDATLRTTYPADTVKGRRQPSPVHIVRLHLEDGGLFVVQGALLEDWEGRSSNDVLPADKAIAIRDMASGDTWAFMASRRYRWSTGSTKAAMGLIRTVGRGWSYLDIVALTLAIAKVLRVKALIVPLAHDIRGTNGNG